jgi:hypothetical protein
MVDVRLICYHWIPLGPRRGSTSLRTALWGGGRMA